MLLGPPQAVTDVAVQVPVVCACRIVPGGAEQTIGNRIVGISEAKEVIAFRAHVSGLELPILAELLLNVEQLDLLDEVLLLYGMEKE